MTTRIALISLLYEGAKKNVKTYTPMCGAVNTPLEALYPPPTLEMTCGKMMISPSFKMFISSTVPTVKYTTLLLAKKKESKACIFVQDYSFKTIKFLNWDFNLTVIAKLYFQLRMLSHTLVN